MRKDRKPVNPEFDYLIYENKLTGVALNQFKEDLVRLAQDFERTARVKTAAIRQPAGTGRGAN